MGASGAVQIAIIYSVVGAVVVVAAVIALIFLVRCVRRRRDPAGSPSASRDLD